VRSEGSQAQARSAAAPGSFTFSRRALKGRQNSPEIFLVVLNATQLQQFKIFFLKRFMAVMLLLVENVLSHSFDLRSTDSYAQISRLPLKFSLSNVSMNPARGIRFDVTQDIVQAVCCLEAD
jgi:hypothetical protein